MRRAAAATNADALRRGSEANGTSDLFFNNAPRKAPYWLKKFALSIKRATSRTYPGAAV